MAFNCLKIIFAYIYCVSIDSVPFIQNGHSKLDPPYVAPESSGGMTDRSLAASGVIILPLCNFFLQ